MSDISLVAAFAAGLLALLSPCSALLLPSFFAYAFASPGMLVLRTLTFYLGLLLTLVPLGTGAGAASQLFYGHRPLLIAIAGWTVIGLGVMQILGRGFSMPFAARLQAWAGTRQAGAGSWASTVVLGAVYGLAGFCSGPVLGAILTVAATQPTPWLGGLLLAVYALGMAAPLLVLALLWERFDLAGRRFLRGRTLSLGRLRLHTTSLVSGVLFVVIGVVFLQYDGTAGLGSALGMPDLTDLESRSQEWVADRTAGMPLWLLPALMAIGAGLVGWRRLRESDPDRGASVRQ